MNEKSHASNRLATCASSTFCQNYVIASARCIRAVSNFPALPPSLALARPNTLTPAHTVYPPTLNYPTTSVYTRSISVRFSLGNFVRSLLIHRPTTTTTTTPPHNVHTRTHVCEYTHACTPTEHPWRVYIYIYIYIYTHTRDKDRYYRASTY